MTLLITVFAAIIATIVWYTKAENKMMIGTLCLMYWGAALMWLVDAIVEYAQIGAEFFNPAASDMLNDTYLGLSIVAFGLIIWLAILFIKDPRDRLKTVLLTKTDK